MPDGQGESLDYSCGEILDPENLPQYYCKYEKDAGGTWRLVASNVPAGYECPSYSENAPQTVKAAATPALYVYPCPIPAP
jgi:hypothetical protein